MPDQSELRVLPIPTALARALQAGGPDAHGLPPERTVSDGQGNPCRHCLREIPAGAGMLVLAHRPFATLQPYAETGPVFLCADPCAAWSGTGLPPALTTSASFAIRGYDGGGRIVYGTGGAVPRAELLARAAALLARPGVVEVHVRSAANGCFQARIKPARGG